MEQFVIVFAIGVVAGVLGGFFGVAGGVIIVPALIVVLSMPMHSAVGTSLAALLPPVGLLGALEFYRRGQVNFSYAMLLAAGLLVGAYFGAIIAGTISGDTLRRTFAVFLAILAVRIFIK